MKKTTARIVYCLTLCTVLVLVDNTRGVAGAVGRERGQPERGGADRAQELYCITNNFN